MNLQIILRPLIKISQPGALQQEAAHVLLEKGQLHHLRLHHHRQQQQQQQHINVEEEDQLPIP